MLDIFKKDILAELNNDDSKDFPSHSRLSTLEGTIEIDESVEHFDSDFKVKIFSATECTEAFIDPSDYIHFSYAIHFGESYVLLCEDRYDKLYIKKINSRKPRTAPARENRSLKNKTIMEIRSSFEGFPFSDKEGGLLVERRLKGKVSAITETDSTVKFKLKTESGNAHECVIVNSLPSLPNVPLNLTEGTYSFKGYIAVHNGCFYVTECTLKNFKEVDSRYSEIPAGLVSEFRKLKLKQKEDIVNLIGFYTHKTATAPPLSYAFSTAEEYELKYSLIKAFLPSTIINVMGRSIADKSLKDNHRLLIYKAVLDKVYASTPPHFDIEDCMKRIGEKYYGREKEIEKILTLLSKEEGCVVCLVGESGVGKSFLIDVISAVTGIPKNEISLNGTNTADALLGSERVFDNASVGKIFRNVQAQQILLLDGCDNMSLGKHSEDPSYALMDMLDSGFLSDKLIEVPINLMELGVKIFLTANDISKFPKAIINKMNVIYLSEYNDSEKSSICERFTFPRELEKAALKDVTVENSAYDVISSRFSLSGGMFDVVANVKTIIDKMKVSLNTKLHIKASDVAELLGVKKWKKTELPTDLQGLKEKFMFFRHLYEKERSDRITELFRLADSEPNEEKKNGYLEELNLLVNIVKGDSFDDIDISSLAKALDSSHFNMQEAKRSFLNNAVLRKRSPKRIKPILLVGPYGAGKTTVTETFARAMNCPYIFIHCHDAKSSDLPERIATRLGQCGTSKVVLLLDELDKMNKLNSPAFSIQSLIDGKLITDSIRCPIEVEDITVVATCNDPSEIPQALLSRFDIVYLDGYSSEEKKHIATNYMLPKLLSDFAATDVSFSEEAVDELLTYSPELGMRDMKNAATNVIAHVLRNKVSVAKGYTITRADVNAALGGKPIKRGNFPQTETIPPGVVKALAVGNNRGLATAIMVSLNEFSDSDIIAGLAGESTTESVIIAKQVCQNLLKKKLPPLFISFAEGAVKKDGASGGLALCVAIMSCYLQKSVDPSYTFTGEVDQLGYIYSVGCKEKIKTANDNAKKFFLPYDNFVQEQENGTLENYSDLEFVPVKHVKDALKILFNMED